MSERDVDRIRRAIAHQQLLAIPRRRLRGDNARFDFWLETAKALVFG